MFGKHIDYNCVQQDTNFVVMSKNSNFFKFETCFNNSNSNHSVSNVKRKNCTHRFLHQDS